MHDTGWPGCTLSTMFLGLVKQLELPYWWRLRIWVMQMHNMNLVAVFELMVVRCMKLLLVRVLRKSWTTLGLLYATFLGILQAVTSSSHDSNFTAVNDNVQSDQQAFYYIEKAVDQLHPGALYLLGAVYLTGECVKKDVASAMWCFHRSSEKGHAGAAIAYGSLLLQGYEVPEAITKFDSKRNSSTGGLRNKGKKNILDPLALAKEQFEVAAGAGCDLGLRWLKRLAEDEKLLQKTT
ncbi:uncharacterized protein LOC122041030 isoform X3 [Zingiber officinale]|uniref:uncharacterized protein LOC122041030 isoform X3 n=1 Tax=Zingiber officinale TaxID=94328 RepID=UPI001C4D8D56|nr:uncharacterized protein LOC122041030 isoform X3 [Zingiber officinale]